MRYLFIVLAILTIGCEDDTASTLVAEEQNKLDSLKSVNCGAVSAHRAPSIDISPPSITRSNVEEGAVDVDPEVLNQTGIFFEFDEPIHHWIIDLKEIATCRGSPSRIRTLTWDLLWNTERHVTLTPPERVVGVPYNTSSFFLRYDTVYLLDIFIVDGGGYCSEGWITFRTRTPE